MSYDYAVSMEGIRTAECSLSEAAHKIANFNLSATQKEQETDQDSVSWSGNVDLADALLQAKQAKITAKANMNILSSEGKLEQTAIDLIG
jgi:hypothetical protein